MNPHLFLQAFLLGLACSIISVVYIDIMGKEPILNWWFVFGEKHGKAIIDGREQERWFYRPLWGCNKCFSGQVALWIYFFSHIHGNSPMDWELSGWFSFPCYNLFFHLLTVCIAIISAVILSHYINKIKNESD